MFFLLVTQSRQQLLKISKYLQPSYLWMRISKQVIIHIRQTTKHSHGCVTTTPADLPCRGPADPGGQAGTTQNIKKFCELCWGRNGHGRTNHVHRTMHILDVISSVSRPSKRNKIVGGWGFAPDYTWRDDSAPTNPLAGFKWPTLRSVLLSGVEGREGGVAKMTYAPGTRNICAATARPR